jgi:hypothetical protein
MYEGRATIPVLKCFFSPHLIVRVRLARALCACLLCALPTSPIAARLEPLLARGGQLRHENLTISQRRANVFRALLFDFKLSVIGAVTLSHR